MTPVKDSNDVAGGGENSRASICQWLEDWPPLMQSEDEEPQWFNIDSIKAPHSSGKLS